MNQIVQGIYCDTRKAKLVAKYAIKKSYMPPCGYLKKWNHWVRIYRTKNNEYFILEKSCCTDTTIAVVNYEDAKEMIMTHGTGKEYLKFMKKFGASESEG